MIKALLFDLDDTLLGNDMRTFVPAYFQAVAGHFPELAPEALSADLLAGTRAMLANTDPGRPVREVFLERFPPTATLGREVTWRRFERFYHTDFQRLQTLTQRRPAGRQIVEWALAAGYRVAVTTSPLFPLAAITARLEWAGLAGLPFELVTHLENSHFTKPHPEYFAGALAELGLRPDEALVVGNDWADDLVPCAALGLPHYWITEPGRPAPDAAAQPLGAGRLEDFLAWAQAHLAALQPPPPPPTAYPALLTGHLTSLLNRLADQPAAVWARRPAAGWSLTELACHLRDVDRNVNRPRVQAVLEQANPFLSGQDTDSWAAERGYAAAAGPAALAEFAAERQALVAALRGQPATAWARPARHALFGPTTLAEIMGWVLDHDRLHLAEARQLLAAAA